MPLRLGMPFHAPAERTPCRTASVVRAFRKETGISRKAVDVELNAPVEWRNSETGSIAVTVTWDKFIQVKLRNR
jgi:hypothetical protein